MKKKWLVVGMIVTVSLLAMPIIGFCSIINKGLEDGLGVWQSLGDWEVIINNNNLPFCGNYYNSSWGFVDDINVESKKSSNSPIPEPATMSLFGMGLLGLAGYGKRKLSKM